MVEAVKASGLEKHSQIRDMLRSTFGLGFGDASVLAHYALDREGMMRALSGEVSAEDALDSIYSGAKAGLRPLHEKLLQEISKFGDFESVPKKAWISLRRARQFAMIGPAANTRVEVGLNMKGIPATARLIGQKPGGMCQYKVRLSTLEEIDQELLGWLKAAYDGAG